MTGRGMDVTSRELLKGNFFLLLGIDSTLVLSMVQMRLSSCRMMTSGCRGSKVMCLTAEGRFSHWVGKCSDSFLEKSVYLRPHTSYSTICQ